MALLVGGVLPLAWWLLFHVALWPLCAAGGVMLGFAAVFAVKMHQDFSKAPYDERHLAEDIPFDPIR